MLRDLEGSYYASDRGEGYASRDNRLAAEQIYADAQALLKLREFQPPDKDFPDALRDNLLFKLRSLARPGGDDGAPGELSHHAALVPGSAPPDPWLRAEEPTAGADVD